MEDKLEKVSKIFSEQTKNTSSTVRQIVFALIALIWAISFENGKVNFDFWSYVSLLLLMLSLFLDIIQSVVAAIYYRKAFYLTRIAMNHSLKEDDLKEDEINCSFQEFCDKIDRITFYFFIIKVLLVPIAFIGIVFKIWGMIN
jgi:hypothetical protein